jgi:hypothetical protein
LFLSEKAGISSSAMSFGDGCEEWLEVHEQGGFMA